MTTTHPTPIRAPVTMEAGLLALFSPPPPGVRSARRASDDGHAPLWRSDAIHRAKNMAQLSTSLANVAEHPSRGWWSTDMVAQARDLSRLFEDLGVDHDVSVELPCATMLAEVATRLTLLFGAARKVTTNVSMEEVWLPSYQRRALVLMGSEFIINALKYGYPADAGGTIAIGLRATADGVEMAVEDDGAGDVAAYTPGEGSGLILGLSTILGAIVTRTSGRGGHGYRVSVLFPTTTVSAGAVAVG